jgi:hypothetical protein
MPSAHSLLKQLRLVRSTFGADAEKIKRSLLAGLARRRLLTLRHLVDYHEDLLFLCAFPGDIDTRRVAVAELAGFSRRWRGVSAAIRAGAENSGMAGTISRPLLAWPLACALVKGEDIDLDWRNAENPAALDLLITKLVSPAEQDAFDGGEYTGRAWVDLARPPGETALRWFVRGGLAARPSTGFPTAWDAAEVPLRWALRDSARSITHARLPLRRPVVRNGFRRLAEPVARHVARPLDGIRLLKRRDATPVIDLARSALAARAREVHAMNHPNAADVHLADLGEGVELAVIGVPEAQRLTLEGNYGYLLIGNGVPIGYGGVSPLFRQANTGINIFDPFRGSEAAFLWAQMLRVFRTMFGTRRFVINGYQFGAGNSEAISSGAYWFYYRLGFRPSLAENAALAAAEAERLRGNPGERTRPALLRQLARGDLHLDLEDFDARDFFEERLLTRLGAAVARRIADLAVRSHHEGEGLLVRAVARDLDVRTLSRWSADERRAFARLAPYAALLDLRAWSDGERRALVAWMRAKGAATERGFATQATEQARFFRELRAVGLDEESRS